MSEQGKVRKGTECDRPLTDEECFEMSEERMCDDDDGNVLHTNE